MSETRTQISECIHSNPGIHFNAITRKLDIATGQTQYHLRKLLRSDTLTSEQVCGRTHYYPPTYTEWEREAIALLRRETTREIVVRLLEEDPQTPSELTDRLGLARSTVEWHLSNLAAHDIITKRPVADGNQVEVVLENPETVYRLLREIEPRLADTFADRFIRLADRLLE